jgi:hypothetical protein
LKKILMIAVVAALSYWGYGNFQKSRGAAPDVIAKPVYAEFRMDMTVPGREFNLALFGKMVDQEDCETRANRVWDKVIKECEACKIRVSSCRSDLEPRYTRLFDDAQIHSTYVSFNRGSPYERDGRMVVYGVSNEEGDKLCEMIMPQFKKQYSGTVSCIQGRRD